MSEHPTAADATRVVIRPVATLLPLGGVLLLASAVCLLVPAAAARSKAVPALVILTSAVRFAVTGIAEIDGGRVWMHRAGWVGAVLPLGRRGASRRALDGRLSDQVVGVANEPGVRQQL